jgi:hypothetical protein
MLLVSLNIGQVGSLSVLHGCDGMVSPGDPTSLLMHRLKTFSCLSPKPGAYMVVITVPCILMDEEMGSRVWCMLRIWHKCEVHCVNRAWALRDTLMVSLTVDGN